MSQNKNISAKRRSQAKLGMLASLSVLTATGFIGKSRLAHKAHTLAGLALIAFSYWHFLQNKRRA